MKGATIVKKLAEGIYLKEIAAEANMSLNTLHKQVENLRKVEQVRTNCELVANYFRKGVIK